MKAVFLMAIASLSIYSSKAQEFRWALSIGSGSDDEGRSMAVDTAGNVYVTGWFRGPADFDPGPDVVQLTVAGVGYNFPDAFLAKYDKYGNYVWAKSIGGKGPGGEYIDADLAYDIALDKEGGVFIAGSCGSGFYPGPGQPPHFPPGGLPDAFIAKYDEDGNFKWAKYIGGPGEDFAYDIELDAWGNIYLCGAFSGNADFNPGPGVAMLQSQGTFDAFFAKYTPDGDLLWAKGIGGSDHDFAEGLAVSQQGEVYVTGRFYAAADFDPGPGATILTPQDDDAFLAKYDSVGGLLWVHQFGSPTHEFGWDVTIDNQGNVLIAGEFGESIDFDPGPGTAILTGTTHENAFFAKYGPDGQYIWANAFYGTNFVNIAWAIAVDKFDNIYVAGEFSATVDFDPGPGFAFLSSSGAADLYFAKFDSAGRYRWCQKIGQSGSDFAKGILVSETGDIYLAGSIKGTNVDFDLGNGVAYLSTVGNEDAFFAKYSLVPGPAGPIFSGHQGMPICLYPHGGIESFAVSPLLNAESYHWGLPPGAEIVGDSLAQSIMVNFTDTITNFPLTVYGASEFGDGAPDTIYVTVVRVPDVIPIARDTVCYGESMVLYTNSDEIGPDAVFWWTSLEPSNQISDPYSPAPVITPLYSSYFVVWVTSPMGCTILDSILVTVLPGIEAEILPPVMVGICPNDFVLFTAVSSNPTPTYEWFLNGLSIAGAEGATYTAQDTGYYQVLITDTYGVCKAYAGVYAAYQPSCDVWPGDAYVDHMVDNLDILPIGLYFGMAGPARDSASNAWRAFPAANWGLSQANGFDVKHADCNGDGIVDMNDTLGIFMNFNSTHAFVGSASNLKDNLPSLYFVPAKEQYSPGEWFEAVLWAGDSSFNVDQLYGIAFSVLLESHAVQNGTAQLFFPPSWLADSGADAIAFSKVEEVSGVAYGALVRTNHQNTSGFGPIAILRFQVSGQAGDSIRLRLLRYLAVDANGMEVGFNTQSADIQVIVGLTDLPQAIPSLRLSPNPTTNSFTLELPAPAPSGTTIHITDPTGRLALTASAEPGSERQQVQTGALPAGLYFVQVLQEGRVVGVSRFVKQ